MQRRRRRMSSTTSAAPGSSTSASDEALVLSYIEGLKALPVVFSDNYQAPPDQLPPRIAVLNVRHLI